MGFAVSTKLRRYQGEATRSATTPMMSIRPAPRRARGHSAANARQAQRAASSSPVNLLPPASPPMTPARSAVDESSSAASAQKSESDEKNARPRSINGEVASQA